MIGVWLVGHPLRASLRLLASPRYAKGREMTHPSNILKILPILVQPSSFARLATARLTETLVRRICSDHHAATDRSFVDRDEAIARAKRFYKEQPLPRYEDTHMGHFIIVDGLSLDYEIGDLGWDSAACTRFRNRRPDSITWSLPIGRPLQNPLVDSAPSGNPASPRLPAPSGWTFRPVNGRLSPE